jgi:hypothetical protein
MKKILISGTLILSFFIVSISRADEYSDAMQRAENLQKHCDKKDAKSLNDCAAGVKLSMATLDKPPRPLISYKGLHEVEIKKYVALEKNSDTKIIGACQSKGMLQFTFYEFKQHGQKLYVLLNDSSGNHFENSSYELVKSLSECTTTSIASQRSIAGFAGPMSYPAANYAIAIPLLNDSGDIQYLLMEEKLVPGVYDVKSLVKTYSFRRAVYEVTPQGLKLVKELVKKDLQHDATIESVLPMSLFF